MDSFVVWLITQLLGNVEPHYSHKMYGTSKREYRGKHRVPISSSADPQSTTKSVGLLNAASL